VQFIINIPLWLLAGVEARTLQQKTEPKQPTVGKNVHSLWGAIYSLCKGCCLIGLLQWASDPVDRMHTLVLLHQLVERGMACKLYCIVLYTAHTWLAVVSVALGDIRGPGRTHSFEATGYAALHATN